MYLRQAPALAFLSTFADELQESLRVSIQDPAFREMADMRTRLDTGGAMYAEVRLDAKEGSDFRFASFELEGSNLFIHLVRDRLTHSSAIVFSEKLCIATGRDAITKTAQQCAALTFKWLDHGAIPNVEELKANVVLLEPIPE